MTEHEIVWEETQDGQELIRLMGERADILWSMDHTWAASAWIVIALVALACILLFGLAVVEARIDAILMRHPEWEAVL